MSRNRYRPHLLVLPEDDANSALANGFIGHQRCNASHCRILPEAGGWQAVLDSFEVSFPAEMRRYAHRIALLLIDFDNDRSRYDYAKRRVPEDLRNRVFVIGTLTEPEDLKRAGLGSLEAIGRSMAGECLGEDVEVWSHQLLRHNRAELEALKNATQSFLFSTE